MTWEVVSGGDRYPGTDCPGHAPSAGRRSLDLQALSVAWELVRTGVPWPLRSVDSLSDPDDGGSPLGVSTAGAHGDALGSGVTGG